ncbi:MAG: hypothetical protein COT85_03130 [Chlamydiae bacterium CG10_big_fil_rev_8_21_14_0_10_42_34]|nr:MAG: hypothetical protein COT85_03130 [Chlamydiae bacterium CG10_big_fil_rev_8_21_14_0_10_42_34]
MYKNGQLPASILIVKTSSLGDIIQSFHVLNDLHARFPYVAIDWAVERAFHPIVEAHPLIRRAIALDIKQNRNIYQSLKELRKDTYDLIFDLQGNCKSGIITLLSRGNVKVGYGYQSVREWPNILATHKRFDVSKNTNIRTFYSKLIERYFQTPSPTNLGGVRFHIDLQEKEKIAAILAKVPSNYKVMVCPGSKWANKQLKPSVLAAFLKQIEQTYNASFLLIWGDLIEKDLCNELAQQLKTSFVVDKLPLPTWQNLMDQLDLVIGVDSSALHLCGTSSTPSFSIFGPTAPEVFKPEGERHCAIQGKCPYGKVFDKQCPVLRSCPTGACVKDLTFEELWQAFQNQHAFLQR